MAPLVILLAPVIAIAMSAILLPRVLHMLAELLGHRLRRSSTTRSELLLARVATETKNFEAEHRAQNKEDDDWEKIVPSQVGSAVNGGRADAEWSGIVGFFHPFW
jgi:alpha-1,2-mannosyltransferase